MVAGRGTAASPAGLMGLLLCHSKQHDGAQPCPKTSCCLCFSCCCCCLAKTCAELQENSVLRSQHRAALEQQSCCCKLLTFETMVTTVVRAPSYRYTSGSLPTGHMGLSRKAPWTCGTVSQGHVCMSTVVMLCCCCETALMLPNRRDAASAALCRDASKFMTNNKTIP